MKRVFKNEKGFTLVELAIVLVIIGIIIGAVVKGQDLIDSARQKRFFSEIKQWEISTWTYADRNGRFPGDTNLDGVIGSGENVNIDFTASGLATAPTTNTLRMGGWTIHFYLGSLVGTRNNFIMACLSHDCATTYATSADLDFGRALDTSIDGIASGTSGRVRAISTTPTASSATWVATASSTPGYVNWVSTTRAILYFFDRVPIP